MGWLAGDVVAFLASFLAGRNEGCYALLTEDGRPKMVLGNMGSFRCDRITGSPLDASGALGVHDNLVYAQAVDYDGARVVLHTAYPHADPPELTDIVFDGVVAYHVEQQGFRGGGVWANILFNAEEADAAFILGRCEDLLTATKNYGWPVLQYDGLDDLVARLTAGGAKCFEISSSCGMCGFVFAASMTLRRRASRAEVAGPS